MKDEELADKYAEEYFGKKTELVEVWKLKSCKDNFLAGLKAGRPQWHKPSEKLPERYTTVLDEDGDKVFYDYDIKCWRYDDADLTISSTPTAWCEIPTFDKVIADTEKRLKESE